MNTTVNSSKTGWFHICLTLSKINTNSPRVNCMQILRIRYTDEFLCVNSTTEDLNGATIYLSWLSPHVIYVYLTSLSVIILNVLLGRRKQGSGPLLSNCRFRRRFYTVVKFHSQSNFCFFTSYLILYIYLWATRVLIHVGKPLYPANSASSRQF